MMTSVPRLVTKVAVEGEMLVYILKGETKKKHITSISRTLFAEALETKDKKGGVGSSSKTRKTHTHR